MKLIALPLACDYVPPYGTGMQHPLEDSPTVRRINACIKYCRTKKKNSAKLLCVASAGYNAKSPTVFTEGAPSIPMCEQMANYIHDTHENVVVKFKPLGWNTESEIKNGIALAKELAGDEAVTLVVCSNLAHLFRVRIQVWKHLPKAWKWKVKFVRAKHHFSFASHKHEVIGFAHALFFAVKYKILGK